MRTASAGYRTPDIRSLFICAINSHLLSANSVYYVAYSVNKIENNLYPYGDYIPLWEDR